jgi:hypothetical protein
VKLLLKVRIVEAEEMGVAIPHKHVAYNITSESQNSGTRRDRLPLQYHTNM